MNTEEKPRQARQNAGMRSRLATMTNRELIVWDHVLSHVVCIEDEFATLGVAGSPPSPSVPALIRELRLEFKRRTSMKSTHELEALKEGENHAQNGHRTED